jgi:hypothetical protein
MVTLAISAVAASDLTGTWKLDFKPDFSGHQTTHACTFEQKGRTIAIDCEGQKMAGEVKDQNVTFEHKSGKQSELTVRYTGTLDEKGTTISGVWRLAPENREGHFEARKQTK